MSQIPIVIDSLVIETMIPKLQAHLICEDVATNFDGKLCLLGVLDRIYADGFPSIGPAIFHISIWDGPAGDYDARIEISKGGETIAEATGRVVLDGNRPYTLVSPLDGLIFPEPGNYQVRTILEEKVMGVSLLKVISTAPEGEEG